MEDFYSYLYSFIWPEPIITIQKNDILTDLYNHSNYILPTIIITTYTLLFIIWIFHPTTTKDIIENTINTINTINTDQNESNNESSNESSNESNHESNHELESSYKTIAKIFEPTTIFESKLEDIINDEESEKSHLEINNNITDIRNNQEIQNDQDKSIDMIFDVSDLESTEDKMESNDSNENIDMNTIIDDDQEKDRSHIGEIKELDNQYDSADEKDK